MARKRGNRWQADVLINGVRVRKSFVTLRDAEAYEVAPIVNPTLTVQELFMNCYEQYWRNSKNHRNAYRITNELIDMLGATAPSNITIITVRTMIKTWRDKGNSDKTVNRKLAALSKCLRFSLPYVPGMVMPAIEFFEESEGRIRFLTAEEERDILYSLPPYYRAFAQFLLYTGCRFSEAQKLEWRDISDGMVTFWERKGGKAGSIPLAKKAAEALETSRVLQTDPTLTRSKGGMRNLSHSRGNQFTGPIEAVAYTGVADTGKPWSIHYDGFKAAWEKAIAECGLSHDKQVTPHVLRHTCISRLVQRGVDIRRVMDWAGHKRIDTTMIYAHLAPNDLLMGKTALDL
jgi:integrase